MTDEKTESVIEKADSESVKSAQKPSSHAHSGRTILLMNRWDTSDVRIEDAGLRQYINIQPVLLPRSSGRNSTLSLRRKHVNIVERFINKLMVPGHKGKKHEITSDHNIGNYIRLYNFVKEAFEIIERRTNKNPVQVLVKAIENSAMYEEVASYRLGGMIARKAVIVSPRRRIDMALRFIAQGTFRQSFKKKAKLSTVIANELIDIYNNDAKTLAIRERQRLEREADGAR